MERLSELGIAPVFEGIGDKSDHYKDRLLLDIAMTAQANGGRSKAMKATAAMRRHFKRYFVGVK